MPHVLLIEPNTVLANLYTQAFIHAGYTVAQAAGAQSAVDAADRQVPDVVIVELQLPGHSGLEFLHEFRSYPEWLKVPVIVHTLLAPTHLAPAREPLRRDLGVTTVLYKPRTTLEDLVKAAQRYLLPA